MAAMEKTKGRTGIRGRENAKGARADVQSVVVQIFGKMNALEIPTEEEALCSPFAL